MNLLVCGGICGGPTLADVEKVFPNLREAADKAPELTKPINYGTAGFRTHADVLPGVMFRVGVLTALRAIQSYPQVVGVCITASHNPEQDNGVKIIDAKDGGMLDQSWEPYATQLANAKTAEDILVVLKQIIDKEEIKLPSAAAVHGTVVVGRDTRKTGIEFTNLVMEGVRAMGCTPVDLGLRTTPQVHWQVYATNRVEDREPMDLSHGNITNYYSFFADAFKEICPQGWKGHLIVDGANGVGAAHFRELAKRLEGLVNVSVVNDGEQSGDVLNFQAGADYCKTEKKAPRNINGNEPSPPGTLHASFDGDADRVVFHDIIRDNEGKCVLRLLDGDRIAILLAVFLQEQIAKAELTELKVGVVQTAYANGSSTKYLKSLGVEVPWVPTGVKHLHHEALKYDVGIYFEANGHGTVIFSKKALTLIERKFKRGSKDNTVTEDVKALHRLYSCTQLINPSIGDAITDLLAVIAVLSLQDIDADKWDDLYTELPNKLMKCEVPDRTKITTTNAETTVVTPPELQPAIDEIVAKYSDGRSFVRPSGTEDIVRIYAEADTQENADKLADEVKQAVQRILV